MLVVGIVLYAFFCAPAISTRGFPPIDPFWNAIPYLWISPVCLSAIFDSWSSKQRQYSLAAYAFATGFFDAGTFTLAVPRHVSVDKMLVVCLLLYGPLHLILSVVAESIMQALLWPLRKLEESANSADQRFRVSTLPLPVWLIAFVIVGATIYFPIAYRGRIFEDTYHSGRKKAESDWRHGEAVRFARWYPMPRADGTTVEYEFDPSSGLKLEFAFTDLGWIKAYNDRIDELLKEFGTPPWSVKSKLVPVDVLVSMLDSEEMTEVTEFPFEVTPGIYFTREEPVSRSGEMFPPGTLWVVMVTDGGRSSLGAGPIFVQQSSEQDVVFIRKERKSIGLYDREGKFLARAWR